MEFRKAIDKDINKIADIEKACFLPAEAASLKRLEERFNAFFENFFVLEDNKEIIGFIHGMSTDNISITDDMYKNAFLHKKEGKIISVFSIAILPKFQKKGYSTILINNYIKNAKDNKKIACILTCKKELIKYYEKFGFINKGVSKSEHGGAIWYDMFLDFDTK